jgi:hypothetical protein
MSHRPNRGAVIAVAEAAIASLIPAMRATNLDPWSALRADLRSRSPDLATRCSSTGLVKA